VHLAVRLGIHTGLVVVGEMGEGLPPQATYLFKHALIQEAAY